MFRTITIFVCAVALAACIPSRGTNSGGDDDDDSVDNNGLGGLDADGDGALTDADLASGESAVFFSRTGGEDDGEEGDAATGATLSPGDGYWALSMPSVGGLALELTLWFEDPVMDTWDRLETGTVELGSVSANAEGMLLWVDTREGDVTITEADASMASGYFDGTVELTVADDTESPTGEVITIEGFAFRDVAYLIPM